MVTWKSWSTFRNADFGCVIVSIIANTAVERPSAVPSETAAIATKPGERRSERAARATVDHEDDGEVVIRSRCKDCLLVSVETDRPNGGLSPSPNAATSYDLELKHCPADHGKQIAVFHRGADDKWQVVAAAAAPTCRCRHRLQFQRRSRLRF